MRDVRIAFRRLLKAPAFSSIAVLTLALGIGLNTSMFSMVNRALFRPLPFPEGDRLVRVFGTSEQSRSWAFAAPYVEDLEAHQGAFAESGVFAQWSATLTEPGAPAEYLMALRVSPGFLAALGIEPVLGRNFTAAEDHPDASVVILPYHVWMRHFGGDPGVVGRTVRVDSRPMTVIGVLPESLHSSIVFGPVGILRPLGLTAAERADREQRLLHLVARLAPGVTPREAEAALGTVASRIAEEHPLEHGGEGVRVIPLQASLLDDAPRNLMLLAAGLAGFVLLIACVNLAGLQLVRAAGRSRETTIRAALGAGRLDLLRPLLVESLVLAVCGGGAGILVALWCNDWISAHTFVFDDARLSLPLDVRVLAFAAAISIVTGLLFGTAPAWSSSQSRIHDSLRRQSRGTTADRSQSRLRHVLVAGEIALVFVLVAGVGFLSTGIQDFIRRDPGWNTDRLASGTVALPEASYPDGAASVAFYQRLRDRLEALPEVEGAAIGWALPMWTYLSTRNVAAGGEAPGSAETGSLAFFNAILPGYFEALRIDLLEGRDLTDHDRADNPSVVVVNESLARSLWPQRSAVGRRITFGDPNDPQRAEVVGVVRDVGFASNLAAPATRFQVYRPFAQEPWGYAQVAIRTSTPAATMIEPLRQTVSELDPDVAIAQASTVRDSMERTWNFFTLVSRLLTGFALLGLLLAAIGIYGVIAQAVARRTPEVGLRLALGAQVHEVLWLVLRSAVALTVAGALIGLAGALTIGQLLRAVIPALSAPQAAVVATVGGALILVALVASYLPASRAARVDPATALRAE